MLSRGGNVDWRVGNASMDNVDLILSSVIVVRVSH